jgi:hypothetical protein
VNGVRNRSNKTNRSKVAEADAQDAKNNQDHAKMRAAGRKCEMIVMFESGFSRTAGDTPYTRMRSPHAPPHGKPAGDGLICCLANLTQTGF